MAFPCINKLIISLYWFRKFFLQTKVGFTMIYTFLLLLNFTAYFISLKAKTQFLMIEQRPWEMLFCQWCILLCDAKEESERLNKTMSSQSWKCDQNPNSFAGRSSVYFNMYELRFGKISSTPNQHLKSILIPSIVQTNRRGSEPHWGFQTF